MTQFISGLDLGQQQDHSAIVTVEAERRPDAHRAGATLMHYAVRHVHRWQLGTPYPSVIADLKEWFARPPLSGTPLVVDRTGVGAAVVDMIRAAGPSALLRPYTITSGHEEGEGTVPKKDLVGAAVAAAQTRRLRYADDLLFTDVLAKELETFRVKVTAARTEVFESWRERDHDDLVLALCFALWYGERHTGGGEYLTDFEVQHHPELPPGTFDRRGLPPDTFS